MSDDINFDDLDDGGYDFDGLEAGVTRPKEDRKAVSVVTTSALEGFKERVTDTGFIGNVLKDSLPKGYKGTLDAADTLSREISSTVDDVKDAIRPGLNEFKNAARTQLPRMRRFLPESLADKLEEKLKVTEVDRGPTREQMQESEVALSMQGFMQAQAEYQDSQTGRTLLQDTIESGKEQARHTSTMQQAQLLQQGIGRLVSYQDSITSQYQQRMLMINQRQYITARDLLDVSKAGFVDLVSQLQAVAKNTALPDEAKILLSESYTQEMRNRLAGKGADFIQGKMAGVQGRVIDNIKNKAKEVAGNFSEGLSQGAGAIDAVNMMAEMEEMTGEKKTTGQRIGGFVGGNIASRLGAKVSKVGGKMLGDNERVKDLNNKLQFALNNKNEIINEFGKGRSDDYGMLGRFTDTLRDLVGTVREDEGSVLQNLQEDALLAVPFDLMTRRSIVEIIPGYLSRMLQQLEINNTGDATTDRLTFSTQSESFERMGKVANDVREAVRPESSREGLAVRTKDVLDRLDSEGQLSPEARKSFGVQILKDLNDGRGFFPERYADYSTYTEVDDSNEIDEIRKLITNRYQIDESGKVGKGSDISKRVVEDNTAVKRLAGDLPNVQNTLNSFVATANKDQLREAGIIRKGKDGIRDEVNSDFIWDTISQDLESVIAGKDIKSDTTEPMVNVTVDDSLPPEKLQRSITNIANTISKSTDAELPDSILQSIYTTLELGNNLTTSMIARLDTWANRDVDEETMESIPEAYIPYLEEIQQRSGSSDETLSEIKALLLGIASGMAMGDGSGVSANKGPGILGKSFGRAKGIAKGGLGALGSYYKGVFSMGGGALKTAKNVAGGAFDMLKGKAKDITGDLYVKGLQLPSLYGAKLKAGKYVDAVTGEVIKSLDDIKGAVKDIDTGQIVLSAEDALKGLRGAKGESVVLNGLKGLMSAPLKFLQAYYGGIGGGLKFAKNVASKGIDFITDRGSKLKDVYVRGEAGPRLLKILMERGEYISAKTGKVISSFDDIDGDVLNSKGEVVLSLADMKKGLVDVFGRKLEFKSILDNVLGFGKSVLGKGLNLGKKLAVGYKNLLVGGTDEEGNEVKSIFGRLTGLLQGVMPSFGGDSVDGKFGKAKYAKEVIINADLAKIFGPYQFGDDSSSSDTGGPDSPIVPPVGGFTTEKFKALPNSLKDVMDSDFVTTKVDETKVIAKRATDKFDQLSDRVKDRLPEVKDKAIGAVDMGVEKLSMFKQRTQDSMPAFKDTAVDKITDAHKRTSILFTDSITNLKDVSAQGQAKVSDGIDKLVTLIDDRMAKVEKTKADTDGDGVRDGSFQDLRQKAKEKAEATKQGAMAAISGPGSALIGSVTGLLGAFGKKVSGWNPFSSGDSEGDDGSLLGDMGSEVAGELGADAIQDRLGNKEERKAKRAAKKAARASRPRGKFGRLFSGAKNLIGAGIDKVKGAGTALKLGAAGMLGMGGATAAAAGATTATAGAATAGGGLLASLGGGGLLATLGKGALMLGRAALGPVGLAATAAYYGYKGAKYLADGGDTEPLEKVRFSQYGINTESSDHLRAVRRLESDMMDEVNFDNDGKASLSRIDLNDIIEEHGENFQVNPNDRASMENFIRWYETVFKPTLLTHATLLRKADEDADLTDVDDELDDPLKQKYVQKAVELLKSSKAIGNVSPFLGENVNSESVMSALNQAVGAVDAKDSDKPKGTAKAIVTATGAASAVSTMKAKPKLPTTPPPTGVSQYDKYASNDARIGDKRKLMLAGLATAGTASNVVDMVTREAYNPDKESIVRKPADFSIDDANFRLKQKYQASLPTSVDPIASTDKAIDETRRRNVESAALITQQQQYMDSVSNEQLKEVNAILRESLGTQRSMDSTLKDIRGLLAEDALKSMSTTKEQEKPKAVTAKLEGFRQQLKRTSNQGKAPASPVVDMKKRA